MSMRSDFLGHLQNDEPLFAVHRKIDVPPLREAELSAVVRQPGAACSRRVSRLMDLPLTSPGARRRNPPRTRGHCRCLSYLLDDMWTQMVGRGDGILRLPAEAMELGGVLAERANAFLSKQPCSQETLRRVLTIRLATVREDGEPTRRRALRSEFTDEEWRLVSELADHPNRLLVTASSTAQQQDESESGQEIGTTYAEVAHEAIFRRWDKLREWITRSSASS